MHIRSECCEEGIGRCQGIVDSKASEGKTIYTLPLPKNLPIKSGVGKEIRAECSGCLNLFRMTGWTVILRNFADNLRRPQYWIRGGNHQIGLHCTNSGPLQLQGIQDEAHDVQDACIAAQYVYHAFQASLQACQLCLSSFWSEGGTGIESSEVE